MTTFVDSPELYAFCERTLAVLIDSGAKGIILLALAGLIVSSLRRSSAAARHLVWALALGGLLLLPVLSLLLPKWHLPILPQSTVQAISLRPAISSTSPTARQKVRPEISTIKTPIVSPSNKIPRTDQIQFAPRLPLKFWLIVIWFGVAFTLLVPLLTGLIFVTCLTRKAEPLADDAWLALVDSLAGGLGLRRRVRVLRTDSFTMPMAMGIWQPMILLPAEAEAWSEDKRQAVLLHELAHVQRCDCLIHVLTRLACVVHWFNPLAWFVLRHVEIEREQACDDLVLHAGAQPAAYADQLLTIARRMYTPVLASTTAIPMARKSDLEQRVLAILDAARNRTSITVSRLIPAVIVLICFMLPFSTAKIQSRFVINYDYTDNFESDPFAGGRWISAGNARWSIEEGAGSIHSIKISNPTPKWLYSTDNIWTTVNNVPQTGFVEVSWKIKYTSLPNPTDHHYMMSFGATGYPHPRGAGDILVVGVNGADRRLTTFDGENVTVSWNPLGYTVPLKKWIKMRVEFNQDYRLYSLYIQEEGRNEVQMRANAPLIGGKRGTARFGDATHQDLVTAANPTCTYYVDDFKVHAIQGSKSNPMPAPIPFVFPGVEDFEGKPLSGGVIGRWKTAGEGISISTAQSNSLSQSIRLQGQGTGANSSDCPRLVAELQDVPQTGKVQVSLSTYFESFDLNSHCLFMHFGREFNVCGIHELLTVGRQTGNRVLCVCDGSGEDWNVGKPPINLPLHTWIRHRIVFNQDALRYSYYVKIGAEPEIAYFENKPTNGKRLGEQGYNFFSSSPFGRNIYYVDDFRISAPDNSPV